MSIFSQDEHSRLFGKHKEALDLFAEGKSREAIMILLDLAEADPCNALVCVDIGRAVLAMGMTDQAVVAARQALELDETNVEALNLLADALEKRGEYQEAMTALRRVIDLAKEPQETPEDLAKEKAPTPLTVPDFGAVFINFKMLGDASNLTLKSVSEGKSRDNIIYITISGEGTEDAHAEYVEASAGEYSRERLLKSLPEDIASAVALFPGDTFKYKYCRKSGITDEKRDRELVVTFAADANELLLASKAADLFLNQTLKPNHVILWLPGNAGIDRENLPECLLLREKRGLEIRYGDEPAALRAYAGARRAHPDALVVTASPDVLYTRCWLEPLYGAYTREPQYVHCHTAHRMLRSPEGRVLAFRNWNLLARDEQGPSDEIYPVTAGGALYAPGHVADAALDVSAFTDVAGGNIDLWLKAMTLEKGVQGKKLLVKSMDINRVAAEGAASPDASAADIAFDDHLAAVENRYHVFAKRPERN